MTSLSAASVFSLIGSALLIAMAFTHLRMRRAIGRARADAPEPVVYPSVTVVRPIKGLDVDLERNVEAALDADYPGEMETIFIFDDARDPAYPVVAGLIAQRRAVANRRAEILFSGPPPPGQTGKLNAMILGAEHARGELIGFGDSDTRPSVNLMRALVATLLAEPQAGDTFAPVVVAGRAQAAGDVGYAMLINSWYGPSVAAAAQPRGELPFIMGQLMIFRREALAAIGGVRCAEGQLVDDMYIGARVAAAGYKNVMIGRPLHIATGGMTMRGFVRLFRRWLLFSQNGLPTDFTGQNWLRGIEFYLAALATVGAFVLHAPAHAILPACALVASIASQVRLQTAFGGAPIPWRYLWVPFTVPLIAPVLVLSSVVTKRVNWRGRSYDLDLQARLAPNS